MITHGRLPLPTRISSGSALRSHTNTNASTNINRGSTTSRRASTDGRTTSSSSSSTASATQGQISRQAQLQEYKAAKKATTTIPPPKSPSAKSIKRPMSSSSASTSAASTSSSTSLSAPRQQRLVSKAVSGALPLPPDDPPIKKIKATMKSSASFASVAPKKADRNRNKDAEAEAEAAAAAALQEKINMHNKKIMVPVQYEPRRHGVADTRAWERKTGQQYNTLKPDEREKANQEIAAIKLSKQAKAST
jgi:hypothetical protein